MRAHSHVLTSLLLRALLRSARLSGGSVRAGAARCRQCQGKRNHLLLSVHFAIIALLQFVIRIARASSNSRNSFHFHSLATGSRHEAAVSEQADRIRQRLQQLRRQS